MKFLVIAFVAVCAFVVVEPKNDQIQVRDSRLVTDAISSAIQDLSQNIKDAGLDPLHIEDENYDFALPVPAIFNSQASIVNLRSTGLSNIIIERINFAVLTQRLTMTISLPRIDFSLEKAAGAVETFGHFLTADASGTLVINQIRASVDVRVSVGIISGISIRSLNINFTMRGIDSNLNVVVHGKDLSAPLNNFLGDTVPTTISDFRAEINELLEIIALRVLEDLL